MFVLIILKNILSVNSTLQNMVYLGFTLLSGLSWHSYHLREKYIVLRRQHQENGSCDSIKKTVLISTTLEHHSNKSEWVPVVVKTRISLSSCFL